MRKKTVSDRVFCSLCLCVVWIGVILTVLPLANVVSVSLSSSEATMARKVLFLPKGLNGDAYKAIAKDFSLIYSMGFTAVITVVHTVLALFLTLCATYPLTKKNMVGKKFFTLVIIVTMYFSGGVIPEYILFKSLKLTNTAWVLILPGLISAYNVMILKSFIVAIPESIEESAIIDGASSFVVLFRIVLPLAAPAMATLGLFYAVARWNTFQDALYYIQNPRLFPLQYKLQMMISATNSNEIAQGEGADLSNVIAENLKSAAIVFATVPIVLVYPWLQKYFVKGVTLGAVKG